MLIIFKHISEQTELRRQATAFKALDFNDLDHFIISINIVFALTYCRSQSVESTKKASMPRPPV
jgi:hypothetical protein